jgi:hypothetical protein
MGIYMVFPKRRIGSMMLLSILVPISLLATFRLVGVIPEPYLEPQVSETTTLETTQWEMERPSGLVSLHGNARSLYEDNFVSISVDFFTYVENDDWYGDYVIVWAFLTGSVSFIQAKFQPVDSDSILDVNEDVFQNSPAYHGAVANMTLVGIKGVGTAASEAYVKAKATDSPSRLDILAYWLFYDVTKNDEDHELRMTFETTFFNGTANRRIIAPAILRIVRDAGNVIDDARDIGSPPARIQGYVGITDADDYFRFYVSTTTTQTLSVNMTPPLDSDFDLELYDGSEALVGDSHNSGAGKSEPIPRIIESYSGYFYARVRWKVGRGLYNMTISLQPALN